MEGRASSAQPFAASPHCLRANPAHGLCAPPFMPFVTFLHLRRRAYCGQRLASGYDL